MPAIIGDFPPEGNSAPTARPGRIGSIIPSMAQDDRHIRGIKAVAFDVYGTLIAVTGVSDLLCELFGEDKGPVLTQRWRDKQLEFTFRRGLMGRYKDFGTCTRQALRWVCAEAGVKCDAETEARLMERYRCLPAHDDAAQALAALRGGPAKLFAFSNGTREQVEAVLGQARLLAYLDGVVSVDDVPSFKPDPRVYRHFLERSGAAAAEEALLVSSNMFDVIGAAAVGMRTAWVNRTGAVFEPWEFGPTVELQALTNLEEVLVVG